MENYPIRERLKIFIKSQGMTVQQFEVTCGFSNAYVNSIRKMPGADKIETIIRLFPNLNKDWLLSGKGEMIINNYNMIENDKGMTNYSLVPLINIDSVGGMSSSNALASGDQFVERLIPFTGAKPGDRAIYQSGDSMTPTIPPGSIMQIRKVDDWQEYFGYGNTFVLWLRDDRRITKQILKYAPDPQNYVTCHSFNPDSADEELPKKFIREVWKVIKVLTDKGW